MPDPHSLDLAAIRSRVELIVEALELPADAVERAMSNPERNLIQFAVRHGQSLDWLLRGDVRGMVRENWRRHGVAPDTRLSA